jgi:hypothetical protein
LYNLDSAIKLLKEKSVLIKNDKIIAITDIQKHTKEFPIIEIVEIE